VLLIALAAGGVLGWILARQPIMAVGCVIIADLIAFVMMTPKVHRDPQSETLSTYALASVGGAFAAGAVGELDLSLLLYPVYYCLANAAMAILIHWRRAASRATSPPSPPPACPSRGTLKDRRCPRLRGAPGWPGPSPGESRA